MDVPDLKQLVIWEKEKKEKREQDEPIVIKSLHLCGIVYFSTYFPTVRLKA